MSSVKSIHFIPQNVVLTPFLTPMPAISHFAFLILRSEKRENLSNVLQLLQSLISHFLQER